MALTRWLALEGLQRSFRRILHALSWAFARSPRAAELEACFALAGRDHDRGLWALGALIGEGEDPGILQFTQDAPHPGRGQIVGGAGHRP
jgi:hypothetical protein